SSRRRHTRFSRDWSSDVCSSDLFFTTPDDVWQILRTLAEERKKREIDPTLSVLREILMQKPGSEDERFAQERMAEMCGLIERLRSEERRGGKERRTVWRAAAEGA